MTQSPSQRNAARAQVYFDDKGVIIAVIVPDSSPSAPPTGLLTPKGCRCMDVELSGELTAVDPWTLHTKFRVDLKGRSPQLEQCDSPQRNPSKKRGKKG